MEKENGKMQSVLVAMLGIALSDRDSLLFGWSMAVLNSDENSLIIADYFKKQAIALGATESEFENALSAMKATNELFGKVD